jgi:hypothetical protein
MDKKIMTLFFLLMIVLAVTATYIAMNQAPLEDQDYTYDGSSEVADDEISGEIDDLFIEEDEEIEIGDMV